MPFVFQCFFSLYNFIWIFIVLYNVIWILRTNCEIIYLSLFFSSSFLLISFTHVFIFLFYFTFFPFFVLILSALVEVNMLVIFLRYFSKLLLCLQVSSCDHKELYISPCHPSITLFFSFQVYALFPYLQFSPQYLLTFHEIFILFLQSHHLIPHSWSSFHHSTSRVPLSHLLLSFHFPLLLMLLSLPYHHRSCLSFTSMHFYYSQGERYSRSNTPWPSCVGNPGQVQFVADVRTEKKWIGRDGSLEKKEEL